MRVPLLDLQAQYLAMQVDINVAIAEVMRSQHFILGPQVQACEQAVANYCGCKHGIGVSSGTDALLASLMAEDIGRGDEVITTAYTFFATVGSIARVGAKPVFVDIDPVTYNLDVAQVAAKITAHTRAIIPVHLFGQMADMEPLMAIARKHQLVVIEDAAQAIGAERDGHRAGSLGDYGCLSFFPSKNLGAAGDGGMVVTNDERRAELLMRLRSHGSKPKYYHKIIGGNFRLDTLQAAIVLAKVQYLDGWTAARQRNAERYERRFADSGLEIAPSRHNVSVHGPQILLPKIVSNRHVFNQYVVRTAQRDQLKAALLGQGVSTEVYYPLPMHLQECFAYLGYRLGELPESERAAKQTLALPIYPELTNEQADHVAECIRNFFLANPVDEPDRDTASACSKTCLG